jgi:hypothetical protein
MCSDTSMQQAAEIQYYGYLHVSYHNDVRIEAVGCKLNYVN